MLSTSERPFENILPSSIASETARLKVARVEDQVGEPARIKLISEHYPWILKRCAQTLRSEPDARDAAQEVALKMHKALPTFEGRSSLRTWLDRIIRNECVNVIRQQKQRARTLENSALAGECEAEHPRSDVGLELSQDDIHDALNALPATQRDVLHLRFFGDLAIAEISELLEISISAAKMRLYRALESFEQSYMAIQAD